MSIVKYSSIHNKVIEDTIRKNEMVINDIIKKLINIFKNKGKVLICGNGGSAADSQHIAAEFISSIDSRIKRKGLAAIALTTDSSVITARANDYSFDEIFSRQIESIGSDKDLLIALSTSGTSKNILLALNSARKLNMQTILFTGLNFNQDDIVDIVLKVESHNTQHIQEAHIMIYHYICLQVESILAN